MRLSDHVNLVVFLLLVQVADVPAQAIDFSIVTLDYAEGHKRVYLMESKDEVVEIGLSTARIVGPYEAELDADSTLTLRSKEEREEGDTIFPPIARAKLPLNIKKPLIILIPSTEGLPYRAVVIDQSLKHFPLGSYLWMNLSPVGVRGFFGEREFVLAAEETTTIILSSKDPDLLEVHLEYKRSNGWKTFARTRWVKEEDKRSLLLTHMDPKIKRMKIKGLVVPPSSSGRK